MIFIEPEMDYFRMQLHRLALPRGICQHDSSPRNSRGLDARTSGKTAGEQKEDNEGESISLEERVEVLHRALMTALCQRFPYESPDTLEHVYILAVSHLSTPPLASTTLSCEEIAALRPTENFLPPELRFRTFPSHLNPLLSSTTQFGSTALPKETEKKKKEGKAASNGDKEDEKGEKGEEKVKDTLADQHYNDTYFLLLPELTREQQLLYQQQQRDANRTRYRRADVGGVSSSNVAGSEPSMWNHTLSPEREESVRVGEGMMGFRVLDGTMIHNVAVTQTSSQDAALRSLQFAVFKIPLSRFTPDEQQYYTNKREEARFCAGISSSLNNNNNNNLSMFSSTESSDNYMNEAMRRMLAFEMPERYGADDDALMKKFFSRCNTVLRCYSTPVAATKNSTELTGEMQEKEKRASSFGTTNTVASDAIKSMESISNISSALGVRRLVYSFAPCDCYHLVTDDNNPLYYAKSSRAAYEARTVSITLVSDLTAAAWPSPTTSVSSHATAIVPLHEKYGGGRETARINRGGGLEGLVCSNQVSRAASPDPCLASTKSTTSCNGKSLSPQSIFSQKRKGSSVARASFHQLTSKTDGFFSLTTSLSCNNVSGNPKHRKESLLEKGLLLGEKEECQPNEATSFQGVNNKKDHALRRGGVLNLFRLLSTSSAAQHELRHGVIRPVVSVAVLDRKKPHFGTFLNGEKSAEVTCHGLLDHTWYSIPVQPLPEMQDDVQWMPIVFGSTECISDVGYRTAMQMGFFPNKANKTKRELSNNQAKSGVLPTLEEARRSLTAGQQDKSALAPLDPNLIPRKEGDPNKLPERDSSLTTKKTEGLGNEDMPASVTARRGGVAMDFGNDDRPASVTARRGGVAMNFGNDDRPASVTARRGGVAMNFGNDDRPASVTARRGGVAMDFGNDDRPASVTARRGGVAMNFGNDDRPASVTARRGGVAMDFGNDDRPASVTARRGGVAMDFGNDDRPASVTARRGGVAMDFGNDDRPASVTARRGGVAMNFGNDDRPASVTARRGGVAMDFGNDDRPASVTARRGGVAMDFGNDDRPASVTARRGGVAMDFGNDDRPASVTARRGGVAMDFGNDDRPASVTARRGGVAMDFGNDDRPASVTARRGGVAMDFGNDDRPASVTARRGGVAMDFGNDDRPASVTARRGGVAMDFGNDDRPASVTARRGGVAMDFGNDDRPASVTARRGGVAMDFGNDDRPASVTARRGGVAMNFGNDDMYGKNTGMDGLGSDVDWRRSASYRSPKAQRPTVCERVGFAQGEPEPSFGIDGGSPLAFRGTARLHKQNASPGLLSRETGMGPPDGMYGVTPVGRWRASSPGPMFGGGGQRGSDWGQNACRPGVAREDSPLPRLAGARRSRLTTGLDPFGKLSSHPSPRPHNGGAGRSSMMGELNYLPPYNDRWQSHDSNNDFLNRMGVPPEHPGGNFGHATTSSLGGGGGGRPPTHRGTDFLASPLSSMSCNGVPIQEENNARRIGGYDRGFAPDPLSRFPPNQAPSTRQNARTPAGNYGTRNFNHPMNNDRIFPRFSSNLAGEAPNYPSNGIFARMNTLYDNGASRMPILDEYGSPRNGSRVRPRGDQAMDMAWSHRWSGFTQPSRTAAATKWATAARRGTPPPPSCRVNRSAAMPWRNRTTTGVGVRRQGLPATRPPLAPSSRLPFRSPAASTGYRAKATPSSVRGLTLRERVRLRQQELRREANVNALREELDGNYCLGNDLKKSRTERFEAFLPKTGNALNPSERFNGITSSAAIIPNTFHDMTMMNTLNNGKAETVVEALGKPAAASLESYWEQVQRLQSLTDPFIEADGVNVSFCLRDLANAFLSLPGGTPKEYDLTKAVWLDEGVSYFISSKPNRFHGGWESYVQHLNLYQQPFYLRERAFIFVLRVPYQPNLRVCVAVHNLDDFIALLQQRPLRQISVTKEEKWMRERLYGGENKMGDPSQTQGKRAKAGIFKRFLHYLHIIKKKTPNSEEHATGDDDDYGETQERGWKQPKVTWRQRLAFLRLQAEATLRGVAWKTFTSPLLTDPTLLQARMSFLSNRTATYAALNHRLNTIEAVSAALEKKRKEEFSKQQQHVRMIENCRVGNVNSVSFGINRTTLQEKQEPAPAAPVPSREPQASSAPLQSTTTARGMKPKREPFRVNRIGDGSATVVRQPREAPPTMRPAESMSTRRTPRQVSETEMGIQTPSRTTLAPYSSSVSLKPLPTSTTTAASSASALAVSSEKPLPSGNEKDALILCAESIAQKANFRREVSSPPLITILKFMSSWDQKEQQKQIFDGCSAQSSTTKMDPIFAGLLPTPTEIHRQEDRFNITVSHMQQLLQWQWEYHQNSYEPSPLPVFRGALVASTSAYFNVTGDSRKMKKEAAEEDGSGISPLSRSLLLSLIRWGWLAPMDYKSSRNKSRLYFLPKHRILSLFVGTSLKSGGNAFFLSLFIITIWRNQFLWLTLVYTSGKCFLVAIRGIFGTCAHGPAALDSATSIVYRQSEAAVETMLEKRQFFRTQSLAIRILKVQNYLQNICSRSVMLLCGYSPFLSLIIGSEVLLFWFLLLCYNYIIFPLLSGTRVIMSGVILEYLLQLFRPVTFIWSSDTAQWCVSVLQPSDTDGKMVCFLFLLYLLWCLRPWSPLRWMCRKTWELFLHDDALVRRPLLSF